MRRRHILLTAAVVAGALCSDAVGAWRAPVDGGLTQAFNYRRSAPFEHGARRGVVFSAEEGERVRAACSGTVSFAGATPRGDVVTLRCGALVATHLGLAGVRTSGGVRVRAGITIGVAGSHGVGLGARRASDRWGYVDPLRLIGQDAPDLGPAPTGRRREPRAPAIEPAPFRRPVARRAPGAAGDPPIVAWLALALVAATLAGVTGGLASTVRRRWGPSTSPRRSTM